MSNAAVPPDTLQRVRDIFIDTVHETLCSALNRLEIDGGVTLEQIAARLGRTASEVRKLMECPDLWTLADLSDLWLVTFGTGPAVVSADEAA
jgi:hypothetical protein